MSRPATGIFERRLLVETEHQVHRLDRLSRAALDEVVGDAEARDHALPGLGPIRANLHTDLRVVRSAHGRDLREALLRNAHERLTLVRLFVERTDLFAARTLRNVGEARREDAARE